MSAERFYQQRGIQLNDLVFSQKNRQLSEYHLPRVEITQLVLGIFSYVKAQFSLDLYQYGTSRFSVLANDDTDKADF